MFLNTPVQTHSIRMRIALLADFPVHVIPEFAEQSPRGHYATWLPQLAEAFEAESNWEIHWLFVTRHSGPQKPFSWKGQTFHPLYIPGKLRALRLYRKDCAAIKERLDGLQPDLVHAWGNEDCYGLAATLSGYRSVLSVQGILSHYVQQVRMHPLVWVQAAYERFVLRRMKLITAESPWACEIVRRYAPDADIRRVEYGVPEVFYRASWKPDAAKPVAIFVGTPERRKGIQDALSAFADPRLNRAELWIVGDKEGTFARQLRNESAKNIRWLGRFPPPEIADLMSRAWCLVVPTRADTGPTVVKEARVLGLPVITTRCGGQRDYITEGENGFFVEPGDVSGLANRLNQLLSDFEMTSRLGMSHHAEHRALFRPEATASAFVALYREVLSPVGSRGERVSD